MKPTFPVILTASIAAQCLADPPGQAILGDARFTAITPHCVRIEYAPGGRFTDLPTYFATRREARDVSAKIAINEHHLTLETAAIRLDYTPDGKPVGPSNLRAAIRTGDATTEWKPGLANTANLGGTERTLDGFDGPKGPLPDGLLARDGWHVVDDSGGVIARDGWYHDRPNDGGTDWYLFGYGHDYKAALKSLAALSGPVPVPRRYTLGAWYSRYWPYTADEFRDIVREYESHGFPLDVMVMDMDWHITEVPDSPPDRKLGWTGFTWNRDLIPDPPALLKWLHEQGLAVTLNDHPADGIWPHEACYPDFMKAMGLALDAPHVEFDAGSRRFLDAFYDASHVPLEEQGVDFWWLDWQQFPQTISVPGMTNLAALNEYYFTRSQRDGKRGVSFSRWAGWGDQRHPIHFSGDASTSFKMLAYEVPFTTAAGNVGCFFWSHDIGGHMGERNEESYARWCQFGAFSAALRSHSTKNAALDRRPWTYPKWAEDSMRTSFRLRSQYFPYTYSSVLQSCAETIPLLRPMYLEYPHDEAAYRQPQQYFYGDHLLVAPIAEAGVGPQRLARQAVWFPPSTAWFNFFTGERFEGGGEHLVAATIDELPLYVRAGTPIPMRPYTPRMATAPLDTLVIRCYPGERGQSKTVRLQEDDGISAASTAASTPLIYSRDHGDRIALDVGGTVGTYAGQPEKRALILEFPCTRKAMDIRVNGEPAIATYDATTSTNTIRIPTASIRRSFTVTLTAPDADPQAARMRAFTRRAGLPAPAADATLSTLLAQAESLTNDPALLAAIRAAAGRGSFGKIESPQGFPATPVKKHYPLPTQ